MCFSKHGSKEKIHPDPDNTKKTHPSIYLFMYLSLDWPQSSRRRGCGRCLSEIDHRTQEVNTIRPDYK